MGSVRSDGCDLYYEEMGEGVPILLIHPAGATASTWGSATEELARIGRVITYDRRGYARSGGEPVRSISTHTADAAAILESLRAPPAVVVGTSAGAAIAVDLAVRRPDLVRAVIAHEFPWRFTRHLPTASQVAALAKIGSLALRGRQGDAAETLLRSAYTYRDGGSAWDAFPEEWRRAGRENARPALADFRNSIGNYPSRDGSRDRRGPRRVQLRRTEPRQHVPARPIARRGHPHCENASDRRGRPRSPLRCNSQLRAAHRRHHHLLRGRTRPLAITSGGRVLTGYQLLPRGRNELPDAREDVRDRRRREAMDSNPRPPA